jgi:hypothetical protein
MASLKKLEKDVIELKKRHKRVEADKARETSISRRIVLIIFTYLAIGIYLSVIGVDQAWLHAIVPAFAFMLSTLTLPYFKKLWIGKIYKKIKK